jgi:hypothetical protein
MRIIQKAFRFVLFAWLAVFISGIVSTATAQTMWQDFTPCEAFFAPSAPLPDAGTISLTDPSDQAIPPIRMNGITTADSGMVVYDSNQGVCWLADANLAATPEIRALLGVTGINPDGTMTYAVALNWVNALNRYDNGWGFLGHNNWQLPVTPQNDSTCSSVNNTISFGASCTGSALGNLYYVGLNRTFPDSVVPYFTDTVLPFSNLQPSLYWTADTSSGGEVTFSFDTGLSGANTTKYNYFHVLPMTLDLLGTPPAGSGVMPYTSGSAAGKAVYDTNKGISWTLDANLAALKNVGVTGTTSIGPAVDGSYLTVPLIDADGAMLFATIEPGGWLTAMNQSQYAGTNNWTIPSLADLQTLYQDLNLQPGDTRLEVRGHVGLLFQNLQPFFYWACERDQNGNGQSPCDPDLSPAAGFEFSFDFDNGFEGTDLDPKQFYVMVYYPAPMHVRTVIIIDSL